MDRPIDDFTQTDALLDAALRSYAEPGENAGLENRVLVRTAEACDKKRLILLPRVWITRVGLAAAAALLIAVALSPALHRHAARQESASPRAVIRTPEPASAMAPTSPPEPRVVRTATRLLRAHKPQMEHAATIASKPFVILPPSPQERILLTLNNAQRNAMVQMRAANPTEAKPVEIRTISIAEIKTKPLTDSGDQE